VPHPAWGTPPSISTPADTRPGSGASPSALRRVEELQEARFPNTQTIDRDGLVAFFESMGWFGELPASERLPLLEEVRSLLDAPEYHRSWETQLHWTRLADRGTADIGPRP